MVSIAWRQRKGNNEDGHVPLLNFGAWPKVVVVEDYCIENFKVILKFDKTSNPICKNTFVRSLVGDFFVFIETEQVILADRKTVSAFQVWKLNLIQFNSIRLPSFVPTATQCVLVANASWPTTVVTTWPIDSISWNPSVGVLLDWFDNRCNYCDQRAEAHCVGAKCYPKERAARELYLLRWAEVAISNGALVLNRNHACKNLSVLLPHHRHRHCPDST